MNSTQEIELNEETTGVTIQVVLTISIFLISIIFGFIPLFCKKCIFNSSFIGIANAFSGGIFLSTGLFHLIPEVN
jgi:amino acid permease